MSRDRFLTSLIIATLLLSSLLTSAGAADRPAVGAAAIVNGSVITRKEVLREAARLRRQRERRKAEPAPEADLFRRACDNLVQRELLFQESLRAGIAVDEGAVDRELARLKLQLGGADALGPTLDLLDISEEELRTDIGRGMAIERYVDERFARQATVTDRRKELRRHLEELRRSAVVDLKGGEAVSL